MTQYIPASWAGEGARVQLLWLVPETVLCVATQNTRAIFANKNSSFLLRSDNTWNIHMNTTETCYCWEQDCSISLCQQISSPGSDQRAEWPDTWYWSPTWLSWSLILARIHTSHHNQEHTQQNTRQSDVIKFISVVTLFNCGQAYCCHKDTNGPTWPGIRHSLLIMGSSKIFVNHRGFVPSGVCLDNSALWEYGRGEVTRLSDDIWDCFMKLFLLQLLHLGPTEMCH